MARCSRCGWEYDLNVYVCDNCGYILQREKIERFRLFRRPEAKVYKPNRPILRIIKILNPLTTPFAYRDINNKKDKRGFRINILLSAFFFALWIVAVSIKLGRESLGFNVLSNPGFEIPLGSTTSIFIGLKWVTQLIIFLIFFFFGIIYYYIMFKIYSWGFSVAANFAVQLNDVLAVRFNVKRKKRRYQNVLSGAAVLRRKILKGEDALSYEKMAQGKDVLTKIKHTGKKKS